MRKNIVAFASLLMASIMILSACQPAATETPPEPIKTSSPAEQPTTIPATEAKELDGAPKEFKIAFVVFLSGGAAAPFGVPAQNTAQALIEEINAGNAPAPYNTPGIAGTPITSIFVDEAGGAEKQVAEYRRLVMEEKVDLVIGYISSTDCLAVAPVADELKALTVAFDCGTARLFEESGYTYFFRTNAHQTIDSVGAARYLAMNFPELNTISGINQNYSWGQDSWQNFRDAYIKLNPSVTVIGEPQFPKIGAGDYSAEISALLSAKPQIIHSSFWGADLDGFINQASTRGLFDESKLVLSVGEYALPSLGELIPQGTVIGGHGTHGAMSPKTELNDWFKKIYFERYQARPTYPAYHMAQAILGIKAAYEKAAAEAGRWPAKEDVIKAFEYLKFESPSGLIRMAIGKGHQAIEDAAFGTAGEFDPATGEVKLENIVVFPAECVNPPDGMTTQQWIDNGFPGAQCP